MKDNDGYDDTKMKKNYDDNNDDEEEEEEEDVPLFPLDINTEIDVLKTRWYEELEAEDSSSSASTEMSIRMLSILR
jgi:hypothetical protein